MGLIIHLSGVVTAYSARKQSRQLWQVMAGMPASDVFLFFLFFFFFCRPFFSTFSSGWSESSGTAAADCRCEGCIRHRLTLAHQDRPKPPASRARLPEGGGVLWASQKGKSDDKRRQGQRRWALSSTFLALSQHGRKAGKAEALHILGI